MNQSLTSRKDKDRESLTGFRLRRHADYQIAYKAARKHQSNAMSWFLAPRQEQSAKSPHPIEPSTTPRVGLTVGKVMGPAHERNRIKRRMRDCLRKHTELLPSGFDLIFHPRRSVLTLEYAKLESEIVRILTQAHKEAEGMRKARPILSNSNPAISNESRS
jgi:ribonuclease P protein component